ncbi:MAG: response regulator [Patescibacteria group bacterium]
MGQKPQSVLIIDDDGFLLDMYAMKFKGCGMDVDAVSDPALALDKLRKGTEYSMILVDIIMPGMTGFEFLEAMRKEGLGKKSTIVVLSNQGQDADIEKAKSLGAKGYIIKASAIPSEVCERAIAFAES